MLGAWGCASAPSIPEKTVYSDFFPQATTRTEYYKDIGLGYFNESKFDKAIEFFKLSLLHDPKNNDARYWLSVSYYRNNQNSLALIELEKLDSVVKMEYPRLKLVSDIYEAANSYENVILMNRKLFLLKGETFALWKIYEMHLNLNQFDLAFQDLQNLEKYNEDPYRIHLARFEILHRQKNYNLALAEISLAEKAKPFDLLAMKKMTELQQQLGKWQDLHNLGSKFSKYHPYDLDVSERVSQAAIRLGAYDDAIAELKKQKKHDSELMGVDFNIAHVLFLKQDFKNVDELYQAVYEHTQSDQSVFYLSKAHLSEAPNGLESLASWAEYYPSVQVHLAQLEWKNNKNDLAMNRMNRAYSLRPDSLEVFQEYGQYMIWNKQYTEAMALIEKGLNKFPDDDKLHILAAYVHFKLNDMKGLHAQIEAAQKINPKNAEIYSVLAELWYEKKKSHSELEWLSQKAINLKSKNRNTKPLLAWVLLQQDKLSEAVKLFEELYDENPNEPFYAESLSEIYKRGIMRSKKSEFQQKALALQAEPNIKSNLDYALKNEREKNEKKPADGNTGERLPAAIDP